MENKTLEAIYIVQTTEGIIELKVPADSFEQRNGWVLALLYDNVVAGVKEECLRAFYLNLST